MQTNRFVVLGHFHSYLPDKNIIIISLPEDKDALLPFTLWGNKLNENMKLLSPGDMVGITGSFVKSKGKFCKLKAERVTFMQGNNAGKELS